MGKKDEYFTMMESQIRKWDAELDTLKAKRDQMSADARMKYDEHLNAMRAHRDAAHAKLQEMRMASESAWKDLQTGADDALAAMKNALDKASTQFKSSRLSEVIRSVGKSALPAHAGPIHTCRSPDAELDELTAPLRPHLLRRKTCRCRSHRRLATHLQ